MHDMRDYQIAAVAGLRQSLAAGNKKPILQLATGSGKTRIAAEICKGASSKGKRVLFLAPRRELIHQAVKAFQGQGLHAGMIMAGERQSILLDLQVASFDTLHARAIRSERMKLPPADLVIVDEAHLSTARTRLDILEAYGEAIVIGLTATPARGDGKGLGAFYDDIVTGPTISELVELGYLVPLRYYAPTEPDLSKLKLDKDGDYQEKALGARMDNPKLIGDIVDNWVRLASDRRTVVFCVTCAHSRHTTEEFVARGITAEHLDGETPKKERAEILARVASGETQVLCNVFVASYGLDIPALDCAVLARPTKNIALYLQTVGRIMRTFPGKVDGLVIDHAGAVKENGFADDFVPWSLDDSKSVKDEKERISKEKSDPKPATCPSCASSFKGQRICPSCGFELVAAGKPIPVHQADLQEVVREAKKDNRDHSWAEKARFHAELAGYAMSKGKLPGWVAHKYRAKYGVWPNDPRAKSQGHMPPSPETLSWIVSQNIRWAKSKKA
jgi:superfamily II DNA or RNA helicase